MAKEHQYQSFRDFFIDTLPLGNFWKCVDENSCVFRGESTNTYELLPSALRKSNKRKLWGMAGRSINEEMDDDYWQVLLEYENIHNFYQIANESGLKIPTNDLTNQHYLNRIPHLVLNEKKSINWIFDEIVEIAALAQHYGVLTRLLDWTKNLYIACYFAALGAIKTQKSDSKDFMVIWVMEKSLVEYYYQRIPLRFVTPSYYNNPNINAQQGLLSYWKIAVNDYSGAKIVMDSQRNKQPVDRTPLDKLLDQYCNENHILEDLLHKIMIPVTDCIEMYQTISKLGYTTSSLFPGYAGVTKQLEEQVDVQRIAREMKTSKTNLLNKPAH